MAGGAASGAASGAVGAFTATTVMALTGRAADITKEAIATAEAQGRHLDPAFVNDLIQARLNDLMAFSALTGAAVAHSLGLDPELAMEVGKRQAKENCVKVLASMCLSQYGRYLAAGAAGAAAVGAGLEAQKHIAQALKKDSSGSGGSSSSSSQDSGKTPPPDPGNHGGGDGDGNGSGNGPKIAAGAGGLGVAGGKKLGQKLESDYKYHDRIRNRGLEDPKAHNFPYSFDQKILSNRPVVQKDGSLLFRETGTLNGKKGVFEIALNPHSKTIFHRTFRGD